MLTIKIIKKIAFRSWLTTICVLLLVVPLCGSISVDSISVDIPKTTLVRGRITWQGKPGYRVSNVKVTIVPRVYKDDESRAKITYTGADGRFDFKVAPGSYVLKVWISETEPKNYLINVRAQKYFDIVVALTP